MDSYLIISSIILTAEEPCVPDYSIPIQSSRKKNNFPALFSQKISADCTAIFQKALSAIDS
jgi:hypothetical protein